jgi:uncharacterized repeat protein (TIGR01451 family)
MKKLTFIYVALLLTALALNSSLIRGLMGWMNTPVTTRAEIAGKDGAMVVTGANTIVNKYGYLAVDAPTGASVIAVNNPGGLNGLDLDTLTAGDLILIIQMAGASIDTSNTLSYGSVTNLNSAGRYEFVTVNSITGNMIRINPPCGGLRFSYSAAGKTQIIRVPQYTSLTVNSGASLTAPAWDGRTGGIVVVHVQNSAIINGVVDTTGLGYRGGALSDAGGGGFRTDYVTTQQDFGAEKGEGLAGYQADYDLAGGRFGRGAPANGGGGGTSHNTGGGGGANGNNGKTWTGQGVMDGNAVGASAWQLDPGYIANGNALTDSSGGGRGGYSYAINNGDALTQGPGHAVWGGDNRREMGGLGGRPAPQDTSGRIFFGGGGGAGAQNNDTGGAGGNGGGLIFIMADSVSGTGSLRSNGADGSPTRGDNRDGAGGAGAGGTIVVAARTLSGVNAQANGGNGGNQFPPAPLYAPESEGPGGGGGGGFIAYSGGSIATQVNPGVNGATQAPSLAEFPVNGATRGATGTVVSSISSIPFCSTNSDLSVTKTNNTTTIVPGAPTTYAIVVRNNGPNDVYGIPVVDNVPAVFTNVSWTCTATAGSSCFTVIGTGNINTLVNLLNGGSATFMLTATPNPSAPAGQVTNTATALPPPGAVDTDPSNNSASDTDMLTPQADLSITKTDGVTSVTAGTGLSYTVVVRNNGPSTVNGATVSDIIPAKLGNASWTCAASVGASCANPGGNGDVNATVNLLPGASATFTIAAAVLPTATGNLVNTATVTPPATVPDTNASNNSATDTDTIDIVADLSIAKTNNAISVVAGTQTTYTIVVSNSGPSAVTGATVADALPSNLTDGSWTCAASPQSSCGSPGGNGNINSTVNLLPNGTATFTLSATLLSTATGTVSNTATTAAPAGATDPSPNNNSSTDTDPIFVSADLAIAKTTTTAQVVPGSSVSYRIVVTNRGPSAVIGAPVTDNLPAALTNASWSCVASAGGQCGAANGAGNVGTTVDLPVNGTATFTITATLSGLITGTLSNTATVAPPSGANDPDPGNNSSTVNDAVTPVADLSIVKTASPNSVPASEEVIYTIAITNNGPATASNVTVTDVLNSGLTLSSATASSGSCSGSTTVTCTIASLGATAPNNVATITIKARVAAGYTLGPLPNTATVSSSTIDPNSGNNSSTVTITVTTPPGARFRFSDISIRTTGNDACIGPGNILNVEVKMTNTGNGRQFNNTGSELTALLPTQLTAVSGSCTSTKGSCTMGSAQVDWNGEVDPGETVTINYRVRVRDNIQVGQRFCTEFRVNYDTNSDGINDATTVAQTCQEANCTPPPCTGTNCPEIGPGTQLSDQNGVVGSDQRPGSILIFPIYVSDATGPNVQNTRISITNIDPMRPAYLHLFFIDGSNCSIADNFLCLTPNQTTSFLVSDLDPGVAGYLVAIAVDSTGCPTKFNYLIGDEYIKLASGHTANLGAEAIVAINPPGCLASSNTATVRMDGNEFSQIGRVLVADNVPSAMDGNSTLLIIDRIGGDLAIGASTIGSLFGILYNDTENAFSFSVNQGSCQLRTPLSQSFPRTTPRFSDVIPAGRSGWMKFWINTSSSDAGLIGATINDNANPTGLRGGHNLHKQTLGNATLTIPVISPSCQ